MYTQCPHCQALFRITPGELKVAHGQVRCGRCQELFNALHGLTNELPSVALDQESETHAREALPAQPDAGAARTDTPPPVPELVDIDQAAETGNEEVAASSSEPEADLPFPLREPPRRRHSALATTGWVALMLALTLVFLGQVAYFWHDELVGRHKELRPWLEQFCGYAGCELAMRRDTHLMDALSSDVRSHPTEDNALVATISFINTADFKQAFPILQLRLYDREQHVVASRRFQPKDYLGTDVDSAKGIAPRQQIDVVLELADPGTEAAGFSFDFL